MVYPAATRKMLLATLLMVLLAHHVTSKPLDVSARITTLLNENISNSLQDKAEAIDTILKLLAEIDLPAICEAVMGERNGDVTQMDNIIAQAAKEQGFPHMMTTKLQNADAIPFPVNFPMKSEDILPADFPLKSKDILKPVKEQAATSAFTEPTSTESPSISTDPSTHVIIQSVQSLKPNVSLSAEARRMNSQEIKRVERPELVGFKLAPSEHYRKELEGETEKTEGKVSGTMETVQSIVEGSTYMTLADEAVTTEPTPDDVDTNTTDATEMNTTTATWASSTSSPTSTEASTPAATSTESDVSTSSVFSTFSTAEIETTTSNEIIEDVVNDTISNISSVETAAASRNVSLPESSAEEVTNETQVMNATTTSEFNSTNELETTSDNITAYQPLNATAADEILSDNSSSSVNESASSYEQTTEKSPNTTIAVNTTEEKAEEQQTTTAVTTETTSNMTESYETNATTTTTTTEATTIVTNATYDARNTTDAFTVLETSENITETDSDAQAIPAELPNTEPTSTLDYFWTPGKTIPMTDSLYEYDDSTDDASSFHVSTSSDYVQEEAADNTNTTVNKTFDITMETTPEVSTEAYPATPSEYDYVYNLEDLTGTNKHDSAYNRYEDAGQYGAYDANNVDYATGEMTDYGMDSLKTNPRFLAGDHFNDASKHQGQNMLASADSPANTAATQDFMLSAQPGYYNSLADQTSWSDNKFQHNSVDGKDFDKSFTAADRKTVAVPSLTDGPNSLAASVGVRQKTVWSEPTLPQIFYQPNGYACPGLFGYYADADDCQAFFICSWGVPYRFLCPKATLWNSIESVCDWSNNVNCSRQK
ncbi:serine-rich adhesin for platelets-like [Haliotis rufescens]|uniref:serine-rich adhesin for platelets-like n=1 Tax=Haliotis rufescens TaxID=6454 RepID=UPI00201F413A|nr:serine-rich adhesin for platelets-like [Haliotis rufescens]